MNLDFDEERDTTFNRLIVSYFNEVDTSGTVSRDQFVMERTEFEKHPELIRQFDEFLADQKQFTRLTETLGFPPASHSPPLRSTNTAMSNQIVGEHDILEEIARGGMGVIFRARHKKLGRIVAIKMMLSGAFASQEEQIRFQSEAQAAANLHHANIVAVYEVGQHDNHAYFSMEYVDGQSLDTLTDENPSSPQHAAKLMAIIADAVHYAHEKGVLHRDLKPSNILIDENQQPKITDFGLAKRLEDEADGKGKMTLTGSILGTPSFMSPEQAMGSHELVDRTSDVFSLGATLYFMLTGKAPFSGATPLDTIQSVVGQPPIALRRINSQIPKDLETVCLKCLEKAPESRYSTARELADELRRFSRGQPVQASPISGLTRVGRWLYQHPYRCLSSLLISSIFAWFLIQTLQIHNNKKLDQMEIPYVVEKTETGLHVQLGNRVSVLIEGESQIDESSRSTGSFQGRGGQNVTINMAGKKVNSKGRTGPMGVNRLEVNGHVFQLYEHSQKLLVESAQSSSLIFWLEHYSSLRLVITPEGAIEVLDPPSG